jgi:hypothetical protein
MKFGKPQANSGLMCAFKNSRLRGKRFTERAIVSEHRPKCFSQMSTQCKHKLFCPTE